MNKNTSYKLKKYVNKIDLSFKAAVILSRVFLSLRFRLAGGHTSGTVVLWFPIL